MIVRTKINPLPIAETDTVQIKQATQARKEYNWTAFTLDYADAAEAAKKAAANGAARYSKYLALTPTAQGQAIPFVIWMINDTNEKELAMTMDEVIEHRLALLDEPAYAHIRTWVAGGPTVRLLIAVDMIREFLESLNNDDFIELNDIGENIFGRTKNYTFWLEFALDTAYPSFTAKTEFSISVGEPTGYHESLSYQRGRSENWF